MWFWVLLGVIAVIIAAPFVMEWRRAPVDDAVRKGWPGKFATLSQGVTAYHWHGPARGPVLVAVHGLTTPSIVWGVVAAGLGGMGYRVLTYDLYGRGLSDAPDGPQDEAFFLRQLTDLLRDQGLDQDITLLGYSMGGSIVTAFTDAYPHRVKRLILLATAGVETRESGFSRFCRTTPILGDFVFYLVGSMRMRNAIPSETAQSEVPGIADALKQQLGRRGYLKAVLSSRRGMLEDVQKNAHRSIGRSDIPTIAIWGEEDKVIPLSALGTLVQWNRRVRQETIPGAGHGVPHTHATDLIEQLREIVVERD